MEQLFGDAAPALCGYVSGFCNKGLDRVSAIVFEDQAKAFGRMSHAWLSSVFHGWQMPTWLIRGLLDQVARRAVRSGIGGRLGAPCALLRGLGMGGGGGTASGLIWNIGYDPVFTAVERAAGSIVPV